MDPNVNPQAALAEIKAALSAALSGDQLAKAWTQSNNQTTGLTQYSLEAPAKTLYPVITPLRNSIPRVVGGQGIQANWKAVVAINTGLVNIGLGEGNRGGVVSTQVNDYFASFKGFGLDDYVTYEADWAAAGFDDAKARATQGLLRSVMIGEEKWILGGLGTFSLGTTPTPVLATATTGGALPASTAHYVRCVALSLEGYVYAAAKSQILGQVTRTNAEGSTDTFNGGSAQASASATVTTGAGAVNVITATVAPVRGAFGYAWYFGTVNAPASLFFAGVTTINSKVLTTTPTGTEQALPTDVASNDRSQNGLCFDGLLSVAAKSGSGAYYASQATGVAGTGTPLTADNAGGIVEIDAMLQSLWDNQKLSPTRLFVSSQEMLGLSKKVLAGGSSGSQRFTFVSQQGQLVASRVIRGYLNPFSMDGASEIPIGIHPNLPPGTILAVTDTLPYTLNGVTDVYRMLLRRDYYQVEWPQRSRKYEYGVYADGVLQHYFPPSLAVITNIAPG